MPAKIPKFSTAHFRNILENLPHIFDANLTHFLPKWNIYIFTEKTMEKLSKFLAEISGGDMHCKKKSVIIPTYKGGSIFPP